MVLMFYGDDILTLNDHVPARYNGCCEAMLALLRCGAKIDARESSGEYPLHVASLYLANRAVDLLLRWDRGAS